MPDHRPIWKQFELMKFSPFQGVSEAKIRLLWESLLAQWRPPSKGGRRVISVLPNICK